MDTIIVNGEIVPVKKATIALAVGSVLSANPKLIIPAHDVSTALLTFIGNDTTPLVTIPFIKQAIDKELDKLNLDKALRRSFDDFIVLVKAQIDAELAKQGLLEDVKVILIREVLEIVQQSAIDRQDLLK